MAYASGCTVNYGDAQSSLFVLRRSTTNAVTSELFLDGASERINVPTGSTISFQVMIVAKTAAGASSCFEAKGGIKNLAGTVTFLGGGVTLNTTSVASEITGITVPQLVRDNTTQTMVLRVTGVSGQTIRWVARVQTVEVGF